MAEEHVLTPVISTVPEFLRFRTGRQRVVAWTCSCEDVIDDDVDVVVHEEQKLQARILQLIVDEAERRGWPSEEPIENLIAVLEHNPDFVDAVRRIRRAN